MTASAIRMLAFAKPHVDVGLYTTELDGMLDWWKSKAGLEYEGMLKLGRGVRQHRHAMNGSVLKLNHSRNPLPAAPASGYRCVRIARADTAHLVELTDPDGNRVKLVPVGADGVTTLGIDVHVSDPIAQGRFYVEAFGFEEVANDTYLCGETRLFLQADPTAARADEMQAPGYRYITLQVFDVDTVHRHVVAKGATEVFPPLTLGAVARVSFVRDPHGNFIELSQRASLTGELPSA